jgi:hypothetical protein
MNNLKCTQCTKEFVPTKEQQNFILSAKEKGMKFIMIKCPNCAKSFPFNPILLGEYNPENKAIQCPVPRCVGFVSFINDEKKNFYGCGECGSIWYDKKNLNKEIKVIIEKYSYRTNVYSINNEAIEPVPLDQEPKDYENWVSKEEEEKRKNFVRG